MSRKEILPMITWLLPVRNGMPFLPETLASLENQTFQDAEILAWDNGSTDGTIETLKEWIPSRIPGRVITDCPLSLAGSLAALVAEARTEFCARIDADDLAHPDRLEKQIAFLRANPEIALVGSSAHLINRSGERVGHWEFPAGTFDIQHELLFQPAIIHPSVLFRREAVLAAGNYREVSSLSNPPAPHHLGEDYDLWIRLALNYPIRNLPEPLISYRRHDNNATTVFVADQGLYTTNNKVIAGHCFAKVLQLSNEESVHSFLTGLPHPVWMLLKILRAFERVHSVGYCKRLRSSSLKRAIPHIIPSRPPLLESFLAWIRGDYPVMRNQLKRALQRSAE